jgi:hypothetical protein
MSKPILLSHIHKGAHTVAVFHNNSPHQALLDLFPDIGLIASKFEHYTSILLLFIKNSFAHFVISAWQDVNTRRSFFINYAEANGFEPLIPESWYLQPKTRMASVKVHLSLISPILLIKRYQRGQVVLLVTMGE